MANSLLEKVNIEKTAKNIKKTAKNLNKETMKASENLVEGAIKAGHDWNKVIEKAAKNGTVLFGKQQDIVFDTLEGIKAQYVSGANRFGKLIGFSAMSKKVSKKVKEATEMAKERVEETRESIDKAYDKAVNIDIVKTVNETVDKVTSKAKARVKDMGQDIEEVLDSAKVEVAVKTKKRAKKAVAKVTVKADDFKVIEGIGPKTANVLQDAGIVTYKQLATTKISTLKEILAAAGPRYNIHNPSTWSKQAKFAAAGRMAELKKFKATLKGGKVVKK